MGNSNNRVVLYEHSDPIVHVHSCIWVLMACYALTTLIMLHALHCSHDHMSNLIFMRSPSPPMHNELMSHYELHSTPILPIKKCRIHSPTYWESPPIYIQWASAKGSTLLLHPWHERYGNYFEELPSIHSPLGHLYKYLIHVLMEDVWNCWVPLCFLW